MAKKKIHSGNPTGVQENINPQKGEKISSKTVADEHILALPNPPSLTGNPLKDDFRNFLWAVWRELDLPAPTPVQMDIAHYLQNGPSRRVVMGYRGVGKSWIASTKAAWNLYRDPNYNNLVVSASKDRSDSFSIFTKRLLADMPFLEHLVPDDRNARWSNVVFDVKGSGASHSPSVKSVGITGQITGSRADEIIADDIETLNNSLTQLMRDRVSEQVKEFDAVLKPGDDKYITYLGTPQLEDSLYLHLMERGYAVRIWPSRVPEDPEKYRGSLAPMIQEMIEHGIRAGTPTDPDRFTDEDLTRRSVSYGKAGFALQYQLDTSLSDADKHPLKVGDLITYSLDPEQGPVKFAWGQDRDNVLNEVSSPGMAGDKFFRPMWRADTVAPYTGCHMFIDPSGGGQDETAYAVVKYLYGYLFLVDSGGFTSGFSEVTLSSLAGIAKQHGVNSVQVEKNFGDGMFTELLKPVFNRTHPVSIEEVRVSTQKERRICDVLEPVLMQHRLVVDKKVVEKDVHETNEPRRGLFYQMTRITRNKGALVHDDRLDALAGAVAYWVEAMAQDHEDGERKRKEELRDMEIQKFIDSWGPPPGHKGRRVWQDLPEV